MKNNSSIMIRLPGDLKKIAAKAAKDDSRTIGSLIRVALQEYLRVHGYATK